MKHASMLFLAVMLTAVVALGISGVGAPEVSAQGDINSLVSIPVEEGPVLDGVADEAFWEEAEAIEVLLRRGINNGTTTAFIKSVYTEDEVHFLVTWEDPTFSWERFPWEMQEDGTWLQLRDPEAGPGDENIYYEDKFAFIWTIGNTMTDFETRGCGPACHRSEDDDDPKPYGNKFTGAEGELGDIWHWKSVRNVDQIHDQYLDHIQYSEETKSAGRHGDPKDEGGYVNNRTEDGTMPMYMLPEGVDDDHTGAPGYIRDDIKVEFDPEGFEPGDRIPGIITSPFVGDAGDISAGYFYDEETTMWVLEITRALETGSEYDVQFDDLAGSYYFGVAAFDNAQVRHSYQSGVNVLTFGE